MEVTVDYSKGTLFVYMCFNILPFRIHTTFVGARHWVALAHWPVVVDYIFIHRSTFIAVVAAERSLRAGICLVSVHIATLEVLTTMGAGNCSKLTANKLLAQFWVQIQVLIQFSQLPRPFAATLLMSAINTKLIQRSSQSFVRKSVEVRYVACWTRFFVRLDAFNARSAETVSTTGHLERFAKDEQTDGTVCF